MCRVMVCTAAFGIGKPYRLLWSVVLLTTNVALYRGVERGERYDELAERRPPAR
jgi:hypothetical protein